MTDKPNTCCVLFAGSILLVFGFPSVVRADDMDSAKQAFFEGVERVEAEDYTGALAAFRTSYRRNPKPGVLINIGMCHQALSNYERALSFFRQYLAEAGDDADPEKIKAARESIDKLSALVGHLTVEAVPDGANVMIDGSPKGATPLLGPIVLNPGNHQLAVTKDGFVAFRTETTVAAGQITRVLAPLEPVATPKKDKDTEAVLVTGTVSKSEKVAPPPIRLNRADTSQTDKNKPILLIAGVSAAIVGVVGGIIGIVYTANGAHTFNDAENLVNKDDGSWTVSKRNEYAVLLDKARRGMIVGYTLAGLFIPVGIAALIVDLKRRKKIKKKTTVSPHGLGVSVVF